MKEDASKLVTEAILGLDGKTIIVGGRAYYISPPTIRKICGAGRYLSEINIDENVGGLITDEDIYENMCKALSWFVQGDESLADVLKDGTLEEVTEGIDVAVSLLGIRNFLRLSVLVKNVKMLIAKQR